MLSIIPETGHVLCVGAAVPETAVNLAYLDYPQLTPESCLALIPYWMDAPGNLDDARAGTRQVRVENIVESHGQWLPAITTGSFYWSETVAAYRVDGALAFDDSGYDPDGAFRYEYTVSPLVSSQTEVPSDVPVMIYDGWGTATDWYALDLAPSPGHGIFDGVTWDASANINSDSGVRLWLAPAAITYIDPEGVSSPVPDYIPADDTLRTPLLTWALGSASPPAARQVLQIAHIFTTNPIALSQIAVYDTRTPGGGVLPSDIPANPDLYFDITPYDGAPIPAGGVVVLFASTDLLDRYGAQRLRDEVERNTACGIACVIRPLP